MVKKYELTPKEIVLSCAALGIDELAGVANVWTDVNEGNFVDEAETVLAELERKGLGSMSFEGGFLWEDEFAGMLKRCSTADRFFSASVSKKGAEERRVAVFSSAGESIVIAFDGTAYSLSQADGAEDDWDELCNGFIGEENIALISEEGTSISSEQLGNARRAGGRDALIELGCPPETAKILTDDRAVYLSALVNADGSSEYLSAVISDFGAVRMEIEYTLEDELVRLACVSDGALREAFTGMLRAVSAE